MITLGRNYGNGNLQPIHSVLSAMNRQIRSTILSQYLMAAKDLTQQICKAFAFLVTAGKQQ
jgi:hypothetical protein